MASSRHFKEPCARHRSPLRSRAHYRPPHGEVSGLEPPSMRLPARKVAHAPEVDEAGSAVVDRTDRDVVAAQARSIGAAVSQTTCGGYHEEGKKIRQGKVFRYVFRMVPESCFSHDFDVFGPAGTRVATAELSDWREIAEIEVRGTRYTARHQTLAKVFTLEREDGLRLAVAEKPSAWRETFSLEHGGERYELEKESPGGAPSSSRALARVSGARSARNPSSGGRRVWSWARSCRSRWYSSCGWPPSCTSVRTSRRIRWAPPRAGHPPTA